jgi:hypothetical protein
MGGRALCLSAAGILAATPLGLLWAVSEARTRPLLGGIDRAGLSARSATPPREEASVPVSGRARGGSPMTLVQPTGGPCAHPLGRSARRIRNDRQQAGTQHASDRVCKRTNRTPRRHVCGTGIAPDVEPADLA